MVWQQIAGAVGSSLLSGLTGKLFGGGGDSMTKQVWAQDSLMRRQLKYNEEYDSRAIQRRIADAKLAGVSPMAALGMSPSGGSAIVGGSVQPRLGDDDGFGQNVGRAIAAAADPMTRINLRLANAQVEGQELDNEYKRSQIARMNGQLGPSMPVVNDPGSPDFKTFQLRDGSSFVGPGPELGQMMENSPVHGAAVVMREVLSKLRQIGRNAVSATEANRGRAYSRAFGDYRR